MKLKLMVYRKKLKEENCLITSLFSVVLYLGIPWSNASTYLTSNLWAILRMTCQLLAIKHNTAGHLCKGCNKSSKIKKGNFKLQHKVCFTYSFSVMQRLFFKDIWGNVFTIIHAFFLIPSIRVILKSPSLKFVLEFQ